MMDALSDTILSIDLDYSALEINAMRFRDGVSEIGACLRGGGLK